MDWDGTGLGLHWKEREQYLFTSESDKAQNKFWGSNGIQTHDLRNTGAMLYQLSYEVSLEAGQVRVRPFCICYRSI